MAWPHVAPTAKAGIGGEDTSAAVPPAMPKSVTGDPSSAATKTTEAAPAAAAAEVTAAKADASGALLER